MNQCITSVSCRRLNSIHIMTSDENEVEETNEVVNDSQEDEGPQVRDCSTLVKDVIGLNNHDLHFGTKEAPAVVQSLYNKMIAGCPGGTGESEAHNMVWFWLEKDRPYECAVCSQFFKLKVVGFGGQPEGEGGL